MNEGMIERGDKYIPSEHRSATAREVYREDIKWDHDPSDARISAQLSYMQDQISKTSSIFNDLISRLDSILIPQMDSTVSPGINDVPRKMASELSNTVDDLNSQINRLQRRIGETLERVQL